MVDISEIQANAALRRISKPENLSTITHFDYEECQALLYIYDRLSEVAKLDRFRFREVLRTALNITDDVMLDLTFHGFDRNNDGIVDQVEWVRGLSSMFRGTAEELIEFVYFIYDMNGDGSLAREELFQCLKGCIVPGYAVEADELEEAERDIVELAMKKLDTDHDGQITFTDFRQAVLADPLLLQAMGACIPSANDMAAFMTLAFKNYRHYSPIFGEFWGHSVTRVSVPKKTVSAPSVSLVSINQSGYLKGSDLKQKRSFQTATQSAVSIAGPSSNTNQSLQHFQTSEDSHKSYHRVHKSQSEYSMGHHQGQKRHSQYSRPKRSFHNNRPQSQHHVNPNSQSQHNHDGQVLNTNNSNQSIASSDFPARRPPHPADHHKHNAYNPTSTYYFMKNAK